MFKRKTTYTIPEGYREHIEATAPTIKYRGNTTIHPEAYISDTCWIVGDVRIGYHAIVMHGACLRGDCDYIEIGAETNIQENCTIHVSRDLPVHIGNNVTIGHNAVIHSCTIGDRTLIGMGAVILDGTKIGSDCIIGAGSLVTNGAKIGNNCIVGAGCVVTEGMVVPDYHMVIGIPGKIKREVSQDEVVSIIESLSEGNLTEAQRMYAEGLVFHPNDDLLRKIGAHCNTLLRYALMAAT